MNILFMTNTYLPHVGGVSRSISSFAEEFRRLGHGVLTVAPEFEPAVEGEVGVLRVPALKHFNGSDFSVPVPTPGLVASAVDQFQPDIVHAHHPFLMGGTALRISQSRGLPLVFTHHTLYDQFTHYISGDPDGETPVLDQFVVSLVTGYANLCDVVIAPSDSVAELLRGRGVESPIEVIPTGIDTARFARGNGEGFRRQHNIPADAFIVGHVGRLAPEKNLDFLAQAAAAFLALRPPAWLVVVGSGPREESIRSALQSAGVADRLLMTGTCAGQQLIDAYHAMDVFAFASQSETQGMVLAEAMAAGLPVVALDGPGVRDVVQESVNGRLLQEQDASAFADALAWIMDRPKAARSELRSKALSTAEELSLPRMAQRELDLYQRVIDHVRSTRPRGETAWSRTTGRLQAEWNLLSNVTQAAAAALEGAPADKPQND
ncbi:MAG TPA: glycosyltransferase [Pirellulaceae bacterium]|nr:glycosyltransferase [Pirellulaceae bacterium]